MLRNAPMADTNLRREVVRAILTDDFKMNTPEMGVDGKNTNKYEIDYCRSLDSIE